jgi:hypothetical protein
MTHISGFERSQILSLPEAVSISPRRAFGVAGVLERIASKYSLEVATLEPSAIRGTRRGIERTVDDFGEARTITIEVMDVKIPFRGDPASFQFSPSSLTIPSQRCEVKNDHLVITLSDDANVQRNVDQFVQQISQNLDTLRAEVANWLPQLRARLDQVAITKMNKISAQNERDENLTFKVD